MLTLLFSCKLNFIDGNNITSIPTEIEKFKNLTYLRVGKWSRYIWSDCGFDCQWHMNYICACDEILTLLFFCKYRFIGNNSITSIPIEIGELKTLTSLLLGKLSLMDLQELRVSLSMMKSLYWFFWRDAHLAVLLQITFYRWHSDNIVSNWVDNIEKLGRAFFE
jgi:hypothetical protein